MSLPFSQMEFHGSPPTSMYVNSMQTVSSVCHVLPKCQTLLWKLSHVSSSGRRCWVLIIYRERLRQRVALSHPEADPIRRAWPALWSSHSQTTGQRLFGILPWPGFQALLLNPGISSWWLFRSHCTGLPQFLSVVKTQAFGCGERHASFWLFPCCISPRCGWR